MCVCIQLVKLLISLGFNIQKNLLALFLPKHWLLTVGRNIRVKKSMVCLLCVFKNAHEITRTRLNPSKLFYINTLHDFAANSSPHVILEHPYHL